jgi:hypothetical protein
MQLEIKNHVMLDLLGIRKYVMQASEAAKYGSWSERNPLAGKMKTCPHCHRRVREGIRMVIPCCTASLVKPLKPVLDKNMSPAVEHPTIKQIFGVAAFAKKRLHPHRSAKKLQMNEWRLKFEDPTPTMTASGGKSTVGEELMKQAQIQMRGLPGFWQPQFVLGKGSAPSLAEQYVAFLRGQRARAKKYQQMKSRAVNYRKSFSPWAKVVHAVKNFSVREWLKTIAWA